MNLFTLACSLRATQPIPRYLPSAAAARQKLLDQMERVEAELVARQESKLRRWADVYRYAFSSALTDIVAQLQELQKYTREVVGESAYVVGNLASVDD